MGSRRLDVIWVFFLPILAGAITAFIKPGLLVSVLMFFGLPSAYLVLKNPNIFKKSLVFAFLVSIPLSLFIDTLAALNGAWIVPKSVFPFRFFGVATIEVYLFGLLWVLYAVLFYEHFFDAGQRHDKMPPRISYFIILSVVLLIYVVVGFTFEKKLLFVPYFYALVGVAFVLFPLGVFLLRYPFFWRRFILVGLYFLFLLCLFEITALTAGQWIFPGADFVGFIMFFGYRVPIEEFVIWICLATPSLLSYYEFFGDDRLLPACDET